MSAMLGARVHSRTARVLIAAAKREISSSTRSTATSTASRRRTRRKETTEAHPEPQQEVPPALALVGAPPTSQAFCSVDKWVVFSDLHVTPATLPTCMRVLERVHQEALDRRAGILFLGDFWDKRGDLAVLPLNEVVREMGSWTQPVLMLPGNHDQVRSLGGGGAVPPAVDRSLPAAATGCHRLLSG